VALDHPVDYVDIAQSCPRSKSQSNNQ